MITGLIMGLVCKLQGLGMHVLFGEILLHATVRGDIDLATFEKVRKAVNVRLRKRTLCFFWYRSMISLKVCTLTTIRMVFIIC